MKDLFLICFLSDKFYEFENVDTLCHIDKSQNMLVSTCVYSPAKKINDKRLLPGHNNSCPRLPAHVVGPFYKSLVSDYKDLKADICNY